MMRPTLLAVLMSTAIPLLALAQTADELKNDQNTPGDILTYGMGYGHQRYSPLTQINRDTVKRLVPAWSYSMADNNGQQSHPLVKDGVIYITDHAKTVALDALTGKQIWKSVIEYAPETTRVVCCGIVNRGAAIFEGKLFRTTLDASVIALDPKTGKELWRTKSADPKDGYSMTVAPLVANGVVIAGVAGAEFGHRGYLEGYDPQTGKVLWRTWTIPEPGQKGSETWPKNDAWKSGGGSTWLTGSYDPELDLVFWGTGNPAPWNPLGRVGDNLYTNTTLAIRPKTGEIAWYYQNTPGDPFDYDGVNELVHADLQVNGQTRKVIMQAHRNGFFYVLERATGKLVAANKFVKVNWADGVEPGDRPTGVERRDQVGVREGSRPHRAHLAVADGRQELGADVVQSANRARLRQWHRLRMGLRAVAARGVGQAQAGSDALFQCEAYKRVRSPGWPRSPAGNRPAHRQVEMGDAAEESQHGRHHGDGGRDRLHRPAHRRVRGGGRRERQAAVAVQPGRRQRRTARHLGARRQAIRDHDQRLVRTLCGAGG